LTAAGSAEKLAVRLFTFVALILSGVHWAGEGVITGTPAALVAQSPEDRSSRCRARRVTRDELLFAMAQHGDYDILATTNRGRFSSELILRLARAAAEADPEGGPLYIEPEDWFAAYIETAGVSAEEAPLPSRLGFQNRQRVMIEYRRRHVIDTVEQGPEPILALNVRAWWEEHENGASKFSFTDTTATPRLKVTSRRHITYRLLEFDGMTVIDKIEGVSGRPVSGLLGALFSIIGEGGVKHSRMAISDDGVQVTRARSKKIFSITVTASVTPDGHASKGLPPDRPDLQAIEERLKSPLEIQYVPYEWAEICNSSAPEQVQS
jgi:hypothetical protein